MTTEEEIRRLEKAISALADIPCDPHILPAFRYLKERLAALLEIVRREKEEVIEDGFGSAWSRTCCQCGKRSMYVVRPGKVQCGWCDA